MLTSSRIFFEEGLQGWMLTGNYQESEDAAVGRVCVCVWGYFSTRVETEGGAVSLGNVQIHTCAHANLTYGTYLCFT